MKDETTLCYEEKRNMKIKWNADNAEFLNYIFLLAFCISDYFFENKTVTDILCIGMGVTMIPIIAALHKKINVWPENKRRSKMWSCVFSLILTTALIVAYIYK